MKTGYKIAIGAFVVGIIFTEIAAYSASAFRYGTFAYNQSAIFGGLAIISGIVSFVAIVIALNAD